MLDLLRSAHARATFFTTAFFARRAPDLVARIAREGHEIANHGLAHRPIDGTFDDQVREISLAQGTLEGISGLPVRGYREPLLRIRGNTLLALKRLGYAYDSSVLPGFVPGRYNNLALPARPFAWRLDGGELVEFPISVTPRVRIPVGWWWFRKNFGASACVAGFNSIWARGRPVILHLHPWELVPAPPGARVPLHIAFRCGRPSVRQVRGILEWAERVGATLAPLCDLALVSALAHADARYVEVRSRVEEQYGQYAQVRARAEHSLRN